MHDEVRATAPHAIQRLYSGTIPCHQMVYPCLKRAYLRGSSLCHLQIVDQVINFRDFYDLLELKYLSSLYIDWHEDAVNSPSWFPDMLAKEEWKKVAQKLVSLEVVVPAIYYNAHYDLPTKDAELLLTSCIQLTCLTLKGAGILEHIDLSIVLANGQCLKSCVLKYCMAKVGSNANYPTSMGLQSLTIVGEKSCALTTFQKLLLKKCLSW